MRALRSQGPCGRKTQNNYSRFGVGIGLNVDAQTSTKVKLCSIKGYAKLLESSPVFIDGAGGIVEGEKVIIKNLVGRSQVLVRPKNYQQQNAA